MKLVCAPQHYEFPEDGSLNVVLYSQAGVPLDGQSSRGSAGQAAKAEVIGQRLEAAPRAWDFLSLALSVVTADRAASRSVSPDGWTREFDLTVALADPIFWKEKTSAIEAALKFLTTDRWHLRFVGGGAQPAPPREPVRPDEDCVVLLSGGLDSLIGVIDLTASDKRPFAVSQVVRGDASKQADFARLIGGGLRHLQLNHNAWTPLAEESSQRARSLIFIAFGVLAATTLNAYHSGAVIPLYICENGFIAVNPPLTGARIGSLSTRTAHPEFLNRIQEILDAAGLRVRIENPYRHATKGEMLANCADQTLLRAEAARSTSCGRFQRFNYKHCGRCVPCQVRRAAFLAWGIQDTTPYVYEALGKDGADHAGFDDVRSVAMAIAQATTEGRDTWIGSALGYPKIGDQAPLRSLIHRGLGELAALHKIYGVK
jgi:7-cyano-7-deazaguanine synthase in queuosine biosynthesis